jgi:hypothetical protein
MFFNPLTPGPQGPSPSKSAVNPNQSSSVQSYTVQAGPNGGHWNSTHPRNFNVGPTRPVF